MVKMRLKHLKIEFLKIIGKLDKSICTECKNMKHIGEHRCVLYLHKSMNFITGNYETKYELCSVHNNDGNCPFFDNKFNDKK